MAARSLNKVMLIGNLTRDPELRYTPQGTAVCTLGVATNRRWMPSEGSEWREETEFHRIVAWQKLAEICAQLLSKGRKVYIEGRLQTRQWTSSDGTKRTTTEIVISDMILLDSRKDSLLKEEAKMTTESAKQRWQEPRAEAESEEETDKEPEPAKDAKDEMNVKAVSDDEKAPASQTDDGQQPSSVQASDDNQPADNGQNANAENNGEETEQKPEEESDKVDAKDIPF